MERECDERETTLADVLKLGSVLEVCGALPQCLVMRHLALRRAVVLLLVAKPRPRASWASAPTTASARRDGVPQILASRRWED